MNLKVIRYKNYGCTFTGPDEDLDWENKFYYSFYELNNGKIICLHQTENWKRGKLIDIDISFFNTSKKLKTGQIFNYKFGKAKADNENEMSLEFFNWFESIPPVNEIKYNEILDKKEKNCVKGFYNKFIDKDIKTNTVEEKDFVLIPPPK